eukprot:CAMPEP_0180518044 /NCGR_PEP_ID=MMETSP1036_2-20121128/54871_1 /TAXON_ID=632150 /ORGANISM="Azadinium spinosum, Strain 3D9" /LENGTH=122 /DNA_ID=CAMNT_0022530143 /DNA_START=131 /DNA_END=499 /DNA_ORIENTATION=-
MVKEEYRIQWATHDAAHVTPNDVGMYPVVDGLNHGVRILEFIPPHNGINHQGKGYQIVLPGVAMNTSVATANRGACVDYPIFSYAIVQTVSPHVSLAGEARGPTGNCQAAAGPCKGTGSPLC